MNYILLAVLLVLFLAFAFFIIKNLVIRAPIPVARSDDHEEELYFKIIDTITHDHNILQLFFSCKNLANKDLFSASDPQVVVYERDNKDDAWKKVGETEIVTNDLNPYFAKGVVYNYFTNNKDSQLKFVIRDIDIHIKTNTIKYDHVGEWQCSVKDLLNAGLEGITAKLNAARGRPGLGEITVVVEPLSRTESDGKKTVVHFNEVLVKGLPLGLPTFFQLFRFSGKTKILTYQSEVQLSAFNPKWKAFYIRERKLDEPLLLVLWKWNMSSYGSVTYIGEVATTLQTLLNDRQLEIPINSKAGKTNVLLTFQYCKVEKKPINDFKTVHRWGHYTRYLNRFSYQDYFNHGLEVQTLCAIDFTTDSAAFHKSVNGSPSLIEQIIEKTLAVVEPLDQDQAYHTYGFGAKLTNGSEDQKPFFAINGNIDKPECIGTQEVIKHYLKSLSLYSFGSMSEVPKKKYSKNDFYPIIDLVLEQVNEGRQIGWLTRKYFLVLVFITGDNITLVDSIRSIVQATAEPISIVLIGIGPYSRFPKLNQLDADDSPLEATNPSVKAKRDIVQFVNIDPEKLTNSDVTSAYLGREILAEIPAQICSYMSMNCISPRNI